MHLLLITTDWDKPKYVSIFDPSPKILALLNAINGKAVGYDDFNIEESAFICRVDGSDLDQASLDIKEKAIALNLGAFSRKAELGHELKGIYSLHFGG